MPKTIDFRYCTTHERYEPESELTIFHGDGTGYCKPKEIEMEVGYEDEVGKG